MALCPSSSTTIIAVSWSRTWLMVTIWPSFIRLLITSAALTDILCARSATVMVSGTCTSRTIISVGAAICCTVSRSLRPARRPPAALGPRQPPAPPVGLPRDLMARRLAASSAQDDDSFSDLTCLFSLRTSPAAVAGLAAAPAAGLWMVPLMVPLTGAVSAGLGGAGFSARSTVLGRAIMSRMAAASVSAALRRFSMDASLAASSTSRFFWSAARSVAASFSFACDRAAASLASCAALSAVACSAAVSVPAPAAAPDLSVLAVFVEASRAACASRSACSRASCSRRSCAARRSCSAARCAASSSA
ncbi:hypothetical protein GALL_433590 [mine drainage metagenome]|uniref:Uncharacterized protein n=1 Tax=mine drainage metagenome TaxID=410659 RepID=A0A1J5PV67_9ZZZZ